MLKRLLSRRVIILLGKGGVGKTALAGALGIAAAGRGLRTLVMECDGRAPLASVFGIPPGYEPREVARGLAVMTLDGQHALEEYLGLVIPGRAILRAVTASPLYQFFVQAAPGLRELMMLGKILYDSDRKRDSRGYHDLIVVDAPASGQALAMLKMPEAARATFGDAIVGREARNIAHLLRDANRTALVTVTTADPLAATETIEIHEALTALKLTPAGILFNRIPPKSFDSSALDRFRRSLAPRQGATAEHLVEIAQAELDQRTFALRALDRV
ncbi:MAG TPA: ArsA-related P-loop ATPase, partial [Candidatus Binatus sp.]|nr:ArsA-related P-loop ATPase [Candidatus Binatus sp.]